MKRQTQPVKKNRQATPKAIVPAVAQTPPKQLSRTLQVKGALLDILQKNSLHFQEVNAELIKIEKTLIRNFQAELRKPAKKRLPVHLQLLGYKTLVEAHGKRVAGNFAIFDRLQGAIGYGDAWLDEKDDENDTSTRSLQRLDREAAKESEDMLKIFASMQVQRQKAKEEQARQERLKLENKSVIDVTYTDTTETTEQEKT